MLKLRQIKAAEFEEVYRIMSDSFPVNEYREYEKQLAIMKKPEYKIFVPKERTGIKGFISVWEFKNFAYVEHFAVHRSYRGKGLGSEILLSLKSKYNCPIVLEVEVPEDSVTKKRVKFYELNEFVLNEWNYIQPSYQPDVPGPHLQLMSYPKDIDEADYDQFKSLVFTNVYGQKDAL